MSGEQAGRIHYVALAGLCLALTFLTQLQQGLFLANLVGVLVGALALIAQMRMGPVLFLVFVGGGQLFHQMSWGRFVPMDRPAGSMEVADVVLCAAVLGFVAAHYRLQGIWHNVVPLDPRQREGTPRRSFPWLSRQAPVVGDKRSVGGITPQELAWLVATLPIWAVVGQLAYAAIPQRWETLGLSYRLVRLLVAVWVLGIGFFVTRMFMHLWRHRQRDAATATLFLQDELWRDTRGEQRRVNRWLAWGRMQDEEVAR